MNKLFIINYENAIWCGGNLTVLVYAESKYEAEILAECHMEDEQRELFSSELEDEPCDDSVVTIISTEEFGPQHEEWYFYCDPSQAEFYPLIN